MTSKHTWPTLTHQLINRRQVSVNLLLSLLGSNFTPLEELQTHPLEPRATRANKFVKPVEALKASLLSKLYNNTRGGGPISFLQSCTTLDPQSMPPVQECGRACALSVSNSSTRVPMLYTRVFPQQLPPLRPVISALIYGRSFSLSYLSRRAMLTS